jgi:hypothetical protein
MLLVCCLGTVAGAAWQPAAWPRVPAYQPSRAFTLDGWIDHTSTWVSDSSYAGAFNEDLSLHTARLVVGAHGRLSPAGRVRYLVRTGATLAQNSLHEQRIYTPELQTDLGWTPWSRLELGLFGRYGWRRPNAFLVDSLRLRDLILGARLASHPTDHTELSVVAGNRRVLNEHDESDHRFLRAELEQRLPAWNQFMLRAWGESTWFGLADSLDFDLQRSLAGLSLAGEVPGGVHLHSSTALVQRKGVRRVLGQNRVRSQLGSHRLAANLGADFTELDERNVTRHHADASWRWMPLTAVGTELRLSTERVQLDDVDHSHRRDALALAVWDWKPLAGPAARLEEQEAHRSWSQPLRRALWLKRATTLRGELGGGWAETRQYGKGITGRGSLELLTPVEPLPWLGLSFRELVRGDLFRIQDLEVVPLGVDQLQKEVDNILGFGTTLLPHGTIQGGHRIEWRRHVGSTLVYSGDTLRNTLHNELWMKWRRPRLQAQASGMVIHHLVEEDPVGLEHRLSLHLRWQPVRLASLNVRGVWRPEHDPLPERMWLRSFVEFEMNKLTLSTDLRFVGDPAHFGDRDTEAWVHVVRRLW